MKSFKFLVFGMLSFLVGCNNGSSGSSVGNANAVRTPASNQSGSLDYYRKYFYRKSDTCPTDPIIHHNFLTIDPVLLPEEVYGKKAYGASELYINEDGTYGLRYEEADLPMRPDAKENTLLWHTRREGKWSINDEDQLVLEGLGYLEPSENKGNPSVKLTYTANVASNGLIGNSAAGEMYDSIVGLEDQILECTDNGDSEFEPVLIE